MKKSTTRLTATATAVRTYVEERYPQLVEHWRSEGAAAEVDRINRLEAVTMPGYEHLLARARAEGWTPERLATEQVSSERLSADQALRVIAEDERLLDKPHAAASPEIGDDRATVPTSLGPANPTYVRRILAAGKR